MPLRWLPNAICVLRMLLVAPIVSTLLTGRYELALLLILVAGFSDGLDGFLAKTFGWQTELGGLLDPAADKLLLVSVFVTLAYAGLVPAALTVVVVLRDVIIVLGAAAYRLLVGSLRAQPTLISKLNTAGQLGFVFLIVAQAAFALPISMLLTGLGALVIFTSITSGFGYVVAWSRRAWHDTHPA